MYISLEKHQRLNSYRPLANAPILSDLNTFNQLCQVGHRCLDWHWNGHRLSEMTDAEVSMAIYYSLLEYMRHDGIWSWLFFYMAQSPELVSGTVKSLRQIGANGMAGHINRALTFFLGSPDAGQRSTGDQWYSLLKRREKLIEDSFRAKYGVNGLSTEKSLEEIGMTRDQWFRFYHGSIKEFSETGQCLAYQRWFEANCRTTPPAPEAVPLFISHFLTDRDWVDCNLEPGEDGLVAASEIVVTLKNEENCDCVALDYPIESWDIGVYYWAPEFQTKCLAYARENIEKVRLRFRSSSSPLWRPRHL